MQSFRSRMNSVLRRPSFSGKSDQSGSESDAPSRKSSGDKDKDNDKGSISKRIHRKRVSFSPRGRSDTADTFEQSLLARQVVDATNASTDKPASLSDAKPQVVVAALPLDASTEYTKVESPVERGESAKDGASEQPIEQVVANEEPVEHVAPTEEAPAPAYAEEPTVEAPAASQVEHCAPVVEASASVEQPGYAKQAATDAWAAAQEQEISRAPVHAPMTPDTKVNDLDDPFNVIMHASPGHSTLNVALEESTPSFPEPAAYDTSFASSSSVPNVPLSMPVPRPTGQPLSAIDELRAKTHPLADWSQKEDINYDADEEETKPLLDNSILTENGPEPMLPGESTLSLRTNVTLFDHKGKGRDTTPVYEALGWTEYILPDTSYYFALHVSSPMSPQHLKMPTPTATSAPTVTVVADYDLRDQGILKRVCEEMRALVKLELPTSDIHSPDAGGWELWLHRPRGYMPSKLDESYPPIVHTWVNHTKRSLAPRPYGTVGLPPKNDGDSITLVNGAHEENDYERLLRELAYWSFIEKHPAHGVVSPTARREAVEGLTWSYADRLIQSDRPVPPTFSQEECQSLLRLLEGFNPLASQQDRMISNRMIASIQSRIVKHRIRCLDAAKASNNSPGSIPKGAGDKKERQDSIAFPFRRAVLGLLSVVICWGIPYLFLDQPSAGTDPISRFKPSEGQVSSGNGVQAYYSMGALQAAAERKNSAMLYGAGVGVTAAVMIGSATTVLTLRPPLNSPARTAAFVALLCAGVSLAASLISLARMSRMSQGGPYSYATYPPSSELFFPGIRRDAESLVVLNAKPFRRAVPLVLLAYSIVSLLVAVLLHNFAPKGF